MTRPKTSRFSINIPRLSWWQYLLLALIVTVMVFLQREWIWGGWYMGIVERDSPFQHFITRAMAACFVISITTGVLLIAKEVIWGRKG